MTTKCANPSCARPFLYFRSGKIYLIDSLSSNDGGSPESARKTVEYFWLCGSCAQEMQVTLDRTGRSLWIGLEFLPWDRKVQPERSCEPPPKHSRCANRIA